LWIGLYPKPFFQILEQPVNQIVQTLHDNANTSAAGSNAVNPNIVNPNAAAPKASN